MYTLIDIEKSDSHTINICKLLKIYKNKLQLTNETQYKLLTLSETKVGRKGTTCM